MLKTKKSDAAPKRSKNRVGNKIRVRGQKGKTYFRAAPGFGEEKPRSGGKKRGGGASTAVKLAALGLLAGTAAGVATKVGQDKQKQQAQAQEKSRIEQERANAERARAEANKKRNENLMKVGAGVATAGVAAYGAKKLYDKNTTIEPYGERQPKELPPSSAYSGGPTKSAEPNRGKPGYGKTVGKKRSKQMSGQPVTRTIDIEGTPVRPALPEQSLSRRRGATRITPAPLPSSGNTIITPPPGMDEMYNKKKRGRPKKSST